MELATDVRDALGDPARSTVVDVARAQAQIDWILWDRMVDQLDRGEAQILASDVPGLVKQVEISALAGELGRELKVSEFTVSRIAAAARRLRDHTPTVWGAFAEGRIDEAKAREISSAVEKLERATSIARLDRQVVRYAERHTTPELRRWLRAFIARVEADLFNERAEDERKNRGVTVIHGGNGMSQLIHDLPSTWAAAIDKRLTKAARAFGADDPRTLAQRKADLAAAWLTTNEIGEPALNADVAVMLQASTLAGADDLPAMSADGSWLIPAPWLFDLAKHAANNVFWHRMVLDPVTDDVLAHEYHGRYAPDILTKALEFRDGVCQTPGCTRPAHLCDIDHRIPFDDGGPTTGWNLGPYCRTHHIHKGFGLIDTGPTAKSPPGHSRNTPLYSVGLPEPTPETKIRHLLATRIDWIWNTAA
jgi:hypothetical protein